MRGRQTGKGGKKSHPVVSGKVAKNKQIDAMGSVWKVTTLRSRVAFIAALCCGNTHVSVKADEVWRTLKNSNIDKLTTSRLEKSVTYSNEADV